MTVVLPVAWQCHDICSAITPTLMQFLPLYHVTNPHDTLSCFATTALQKVAANQCSSVLQSVILSGRLHVVHVGRSRETFPEGPQPQLVETKQLAPRSDKHTPVGRTRKAPVGLGVRLPALPYPAHSFNLFCMLFFISTIRFGKKVLLNSPQYQHCTSTYTTV